MFGQRDFEFELIELDPAMEDFGSRIRFIIQTTDWYGGPGQDEKGYQLPKYFWDDLLRMRLAKLIGYEDLEMSDVKRLLDMYSYDSHWFVGSAPIPLHRDVADFEANDNLDIYNCQIDYIDTIDDVTEIAKVCNQTLVSDHPCYTYCTNVAKLMKIEDKIVQLFELSLEKVTDHGELKSVPRCGYRGFNKTKSCWTTSLTEHGFCYASNPSKIKYMKWLYVNKFM